MHAIPDPSSMDPRFRGDDERRGDNERGGDDYYRLPPGRTGAPITS